MLRRPYIFHHRTTSYTISDTAAYSLSSTTSGGMAREAVQLVRAISNESARWSAGTWTSAAISRHLLGAIAMAVQRGNAIAMLSGNTRAAPTHAAIVEENGAGEAREQMSGSEKDGEENGMTDGRNKEHEHGSAGCGVCGVL